MTSVLSDGLLALTALLAAAYCWRRRDAAAALGLLLLGTAAAVGSVEYAGWAELAALHGGLSSWAAWASLTLLALHGGSVRRALIVAGVAVLASWVLANSPLQLLVNIGALLVLLWRCWPKGWRHFAPAVCGAAGFSLAGLLIGTQGSWGEIARLDIYHVVLALSVLGFALALRPSASRGTA